MSIKRTNLFLLEIKPEAASHPQGNRVLTLKKVDSSGKILISGGAWRFSEFQGKIRVLSGKIHCHLRVLNIKASYGEFWCEVLNANDPEMAQFLNRPDLAC